ncbi:MAG: hypothetical protein FJY65_05285 [Calditrichaeota bacterium]|nr:hypothetical protein [Calditrichota bacterium]
MRRRPERLNKFLSVLGAYSHPLILTHNNPDPDAIASAWGMKKLLENNGWNEVTLGYSGLLGRAENRALVKALSEPFIRLEDLEGQSGGEPDGRRLSTRPMPLDAYDGLVIVDGQPGAGNISLPASIPVAAVLDHHPRLQNLSADFIDVRPAFGACTALVYEYFKQCDLEPDKITATAFYYAIRTETQELGREADYRDRWLFRHLAHRVDWILLHSIAHAPVPRSYYATFKIALERARLYRDAIFADAGELPIPDASAEIADWLLRLDEVKWALCCGTYRGRLLFSLRSLVIDARCGAIAVRIVENWGLAGGHGSMAGGQIKLAPSGYNRNTALAELERRYLAVMGYSGETPVEDPFAIVPGELSRRKFGADLA